MGNFVAITLAVSALLQLAAALLALRAVPHSGSYRYVWIALSLALALMVERRVQPLLEFRDGGADLAEALFALLISALMAFSMVGLDRLLRAIRTHEEQLTRLATTDALTGLANRRHLLAELEKELRRAARSGRPLSVLMVDLDRFKGVNDQYGHAAGDAVLVAVAGRCLARLRAIDLCGRIGGEEFVVLLPETPLAEAQQTLTRLQRSLTEALFLHEQREVFVTFSAGVTSWRAGEALEAALERADEALYEAKRSGKNRSCVA
jgi:diguanylate cyclase (GGDEF)-like protein